MRNTIFTLAIFFACSLTGHAQFFTITKTESIEKKSKIQNLEYVDNDTITFIHPDDMPALEPSDPEYWDDPHPYASARKRNVRNRKDKESRSEISSSRIVNVGGKYTSGLPELTIPNLIREFKKNNIQHPEIVLAQAILETGWFTSPVCKNMNNLFGLTNPRTHYYYSFNHWTESVKAYYTKVQYRYKGGDYLKWLDDIGYAESKVYIKKVVDVIKTLRKTNYKKPGSA